MTDTTIRSTEGAGPSFYPYPSAFCSFYEQTPPPGWMPRYGDIITNVSRDYPELLAHLTDPANAWKVTSEEQWQAASRTEPWNGIGGVPYFAVDAANDTIRLPDTRGMYEEDAGFDGMTVGGVHGDAIRKLQGTIPIECPGQTSLDNIFYRDPAISPRWEVGLPTNYQGQIGFDSSRVVPTANKNQPRAFGVLPCVYVGGIAGSDTPGGGGGDGFIPDLVTGEEIRWPLKRNGKQVYAKLIEFGGLPAPFGLRGVTHGVRDIEWKQIAWDHSSITRSTDGQEVVLSAASTPAISNSALPWRFAVDKTSVQCNMLTMTDYREWDRVLLCLLYTKRG